MRRRITCERLRSIKRRRRRRHQIGFEDKGRTRTVVGKNIGNVVTRRNSRIRDHKYKKSSHKKKERKVNKEGGAGAGGFVPVGLIKPESDPLHLRHLGQQPLGLLPPLCEAPLKGNH